MTVGAVMGEEINTSLLMLKPWRGVFISGCCYSILFACFFCHFVSLAIPVLFVHLYMSVLFVLFYIVLLPEVVGGW